MPSTYNMQKDDTLYRAVVLFRISGPKGAGMELKQYFPADGGATVLYHRSYTYGPYSRVGSAKAALTKYWKTQPKETYDAFLQSVPATSWEEV